MQESPAVGAEAPRAHDPNDDYGEDAYLYLGISQTRGQVMVMPELEFVSGQLEKEGRVLKERRKLVEERKLVRSQGKAKAKGRASAEAGHD